METDLSTKPTDKHQYLHLSSCHPHHTKRYIPYSLALHLHRICSSHDSYIQRTNELINYLTESWLPQSHSHDTNTSCLRRSRADALKYKPPTRTENTPSVITYNPTLPNVAHIVHKHSYPLYSSERRRNVFKNLPIVAYCRSNCLSDILVRAQWPETDNCNNARATPGSFRCNSRNCTTCPYIDHGCNNYTYYTLRVKPTNLTLLVVLSMLST